MSVTVINKMKNVIRDITKLLVTYFVPVIIITMFICFCMDMPGTTAAIVGSLMGYFFICFDGGKARKAIWRATSTFSKVYSFFDSDRTNVYHEDLTPLHHVTVSTPALFHIENLQPTITPETVITKLTKKNDFRGKRYLQVAIPVDTKQKNAGLSGKALVSIPREYLVDSRILQMCNNPSFTADNWTITEISSRQLLKFKSVKYWKVSGKASQPNEVTVCPLFKEIKIQFGYNVIDCGSCLFHCKAFSANNDDTTEKFIRNIASRGIQRIVVKADTLKEANEALTFCQKYRHFIYVNAGFNAYLEEQGVRACLRQLKQSCTGLACIGDIPLCYRKGKLAKDRQLSNFKELVPFCYNRQIPIHFHVGPNECIHENFLQALSSYPLMIYSWCISFDEDSLFTEKDVATLINKFRCFVMVDAHNLKCNSRFVSLMEKKIIPVEKILLRSNAPFSFFGKSKKETWHSMKDFQVHFLRKQLRYLHPESLETMFSEDGSSVPTILCCMIELLAGIVDVPPLSLAKILIKNAESFFKFSDPSISYSSQSRDANP